MSAQKKTLTRRDFLRASSVIVGAAALTACSPAAVPAPTAAPAAPAAPAAAATTAAPAAAAPTATAGGPTPVPTVAVGIYGTAAQPVVLQNGLTGADGGVFGTLLTAYSKAFPDQAVRSEAYTWDVFFQKFPTAVAAGTPPDMAIFHATEVPQMASQGIMMPMDDVYAKLAIPADDFVQTVMDMVTVNGKKMAVPFDNHGWTCYVNTKVIKDAGLDPANLPKNGDEFIPWAKKITVDDSGKHPDETGFNPDKVKIWAHYFSWPRYTMPSTWFDYGGGTFDPKTNKARLNSAESVAAVQYWYDLMYKHYVSPPALPGVATDYDIYKTDSLAIMWDGTWSLSFFKDNPDVGAHTICVPLNSLAPSGDAFQKIDAHIMCIPVGVKQDGIDRASKLIKFLSDNGKLWATSGQIPARKSVQNDPDVQAIWSVKASAAAFNKQGRTDFPHKAFIEIQTAWENTVSAALAKTTPVKEALDQGNATIQTILDRG